MDLIKGDFVIKPVQATDNPRRVGEVDFVLLAGKGWQKRRSCPAMQPMIGPNTCVAPLGNGVEAPALGLAAVLGMGPVLGGLCRISAFIAEPGYIRHVGLEPSVAFGESDNRSTSRVEALRAGLRASGCQGERPAGHPGGDVGEVCIHRLRQRSGGGCTCPAGSPCAACQRRASCWSKPSTKPSPWGARVRSRSRPRISSPGPWR